MDESKKESIRQEARAILDKFAKALEKVPSVKKKEIKESSVRKESEGLKCSDDFRKRFFANAPKKDKECITAEKGAWT